LSLNDLIGVAFAEEARGGKSTELRLGAFEALAGGVFDVTASVWDGFPQTSLLHMMLAC
jgi:hypothetical protein